MRLTATTLLAAALLTAGCMGSTPSSATRLSTDGANIGIYGGVSSMVNQYRSGSGLPSISRSARLDRVAMAHAQDQQRHNFFGHSGSNGSNVQRRMELAGYEPCLAAENIAMGQINEPAVLADWMASSGHRFNMMHRRVTEFGFGRSGDYWVMVLARPC